MRDYTAAWDCTFNLDGKTEHVTFLTDDFETVYEEYKRLKTQHRVCIFVAHELKSKAKVLVSAEMLTDPNVILPGDPEPRPVMDAENPRTPAQVRNAARRGEVNGHEPWMDRHNEDIARHALREPPQDKI